jgi:DNA-binding transcriptional LysR family regulator
MSEPDLSDLHAFLAVARSRGFRQAALLRGVSASSLSEAIRRLETRLGVRLLNRTTRSVTPTEAGERLIERLAPAFAEIAGALDAVNGFRDSPTGTLRLNVPTIVSREILPPIIARFLAAHPGITLELSATDNFIDVLAAGFDAGIRYDERIERDMIAVPIGPRTQRFVAAAAPAYLEAHGEPKHPRDLVNHACIGHRFESGVLAVWEFVREAIDRGTLVPVLKPWWQSFTGPRLYYPSRAHVPGPLRAFIDFVRAEA